MIRIVLGGIVGGLLMFAVGAGTHMGLEAESRHIQRVPSEASARDYFNSEKLTEGIYGFPIPKVGFESMTKGEYEAEYNRINDLYKQGPAGYLIVAPRGEDMMGPKQLVGELLANVAAALLACILVANFASQTGFLSRWLLVVLLGPIGWLTLSLSHGLWYRFPMPFVLDGLCVSLAEWAVAGLAIVTIVRYPPRPD